jgi:hypothetical protein
VIEGTIRHDGATITVDGGATRHLPKASPAANAAATRWTNAARFSAGSNAAVAISWASSSS